MEEETLNETPTANDSNIEVYIIEPNNYRLSNIIHSLSAAGRKSEICFETYQIGRNFYHINDAQSIRLDNNLCYKGYSDDEDIEENLSALLSSLGLGQACGDVLFIVNMNFLSRDSMDEAYYEKLSLLLRTLCVVPDDIRKVHILLTSMTHLYQRDLWTRHLDLAESQLERISHVCYRDLVLDDLNPDDFLAEYIINEFSSSSGDYVLWSEDSI